MVERYLSALERSDSRELERVAETRGNPALVAAELRAAGGRPLDREQVTVVVGDVSSRFGSVTFATPNPTRRLLVVVQGVWKVDLGEAGVSKRPPDTAATQRP
jgi:hypothetical protein